MKDEYIITQQELAQDYALDLSKYVIDDGVIPLFIKIALEKCITRILYLNDIFNYEDDIEKVLDENQKLIKPFKKLQFQMCYNLTFLGDTNPINQDIDHIIGSDLRMCKINGYQKQINIK